MQHAEPAHRPSPPREPPGVESALRGPARQLVEHHPLGVVVTRRIALPVEQAAVGAHEHERRRPPAHRGRQEPRQAERLEVRGPRRGAVEDEAYREPLSIAVAVRHRREEVDVAPAGGGVHRLEPDNSFGR